MLQTDRGLWKEARKEVGKGKCKENEGEDKPCTQRKNEVRLSARVCVCAL